MCSNDGPSDFSACTPFTNEEPEAPLQNHPAFSANKGISARVTRVAYCQDATCSFAGLSPHLSVEIGYVPLGRKNATAISYAWGDFHREKIRIGHMHGDASAHVQLELGKEWVIRDFIDRLAELSKDSPIWIDQICIPQKEEAIRQVLANIPAVFRAFNVVALMPGHPCKCLDDFLENHMPLILAAENKTHNERFQVLEKFTEYQCLSGLGLSSWFQRIWTRQELMCSSQIRCVWASAQRAKCISWNALKRNDLGPYMALYFKKLEGDGFSEKAIRIRLMILQRTWYKGAYYDLLAYLTGSHETASVMASVFRFFGGEIIQRGRAIVDERVGNLIEEFVTELRRLAIPSSETSIRKATHSGDYIVSIWVDCPGYIVPPGYRTMDAPELLNNAMAQLRHNYGVALLTTAPRGLFDSGTPGSALFDAVTHFSTAPIHNVAELYGPISGDFRSIFLVDQTGAVPILFSPRYPVALSHYAEEYTAFSESFGELKASILIPFFQDVFSLCSNMCAAKLVNRMQTLFHLLLEKCLETEGKEEPLEEWLHIGRSMALLENLVRKNESSQEMFSQLWLNCIGDYYATLSDEIFDGRWEAILYDFMAVSLGISREVCRTAGVAIMVDPGDPKVARPPRIGFFRGDVDLRKLRCSQDPGAGTRRAVTVCMRTNSEWLDLTSNELGKATTLFEAYLVEGSGSEDMPKYKVFGIWIPTAVTKSEEYGASLGSLEEGGADAFLI